MQHFASPFDVLAHMVTLRVHIDVAPITYARQGRYCRRRIGQVIRRCGTRADSNVHRSGL